MDQPSSSLNGFKPLPIQNTNFCGLNEESRFSWYLREQTPQPVADKLSWHNHDAPAINDALSCRKFR